MGRGLDGYISFALRRTTPQALMWLLCGFEGSGGGVLSPVPVAMARGKHLFPFRTEKLSLSAPMVLGSQGPGRVGRRRFA